MIVYFSLELQIQLDDAKHTLRHTDNDRLLGQALH